jgi:IgA Peptidase M64
MHSLRDNRLNIVFILMLLYLAIPLPSAESATPVNIQKTGPSENRLDVVFLAEGFTAAERTKFLAEVRKVRQAWKTQEPWKSIFRMINIYAVPLASAESGIDHPSEGITKNTILDGAFDCGGTARLVCVNVGKAITEASSAVPVFDEAVVMVNDKTYGGSGGFVAVFTLHATSKELFFHEFGHSFGQLADEYDYGGNTQTTEPSEVNVTKQKARPKIKWNKWILPGTPLPTPNSNTDSIGLFRGAFYYPSRFFRPKFNCKMRELEVPFCEICREAHILRMYDETSAVDVFTPARDVTMSRNGSQNFTVKLAPIPKARLKLEWLIDGVPQAGKTGIAFLLSGNQVSPGMHHVVCRITDTTGQVKNDKNGLLSTSVTWNLLVQ